MSDNEAETAEAQDELGTLLPDQTVTLPVSGEEVEVREFRFAEGLRVTREVRPLIDHLRSLAAAGEVEDTDTLRLVEDHPEEWQTIIAHATGQDRAWVEGLHDEDGLTLAVAAWEVNSGFFMRRLAWGMGQATAASPSDTPTSSPDS